MGIDELNWRQRYGGEEIIELYQQGRMSRREMMRQLVLICGSLTTASALLAACGDSGGDSSPTTTASPTSTAAAGTSTSTGSTTTAKPGAPLSVAADDPAIKAGAVTFPGPAGTMQAYVARPSAGGSRAGVLVIHEIFGLNDHIRDVARRVAKLGYLALALDLASRAGGSAAASNVSGVLTGGSDADKVADLDAGLRYLEAQGDFNGKLGITGFCFGGGITLLYASAQPKVLAAVPYYGTPPSPVTRMADAKAAILAHYGGNDSRVNGTIAGLEQALAGKTFEKHVWDGAGHAFNNDTGANYNEKVAVEAWKLTTDWFKKYLG